VLSNAHMRCLGRYEPQGTGERREIITLPAARTGTLVVDRVVGTHSDARLIARLAPDEPGANALIVTALYLADATQSRCRPLLDADVGVAARPSVP
jgi:hypothetical protein